MPVTGSSTVPPLVVALVRAAQWWPLVLVAPLVPVLAVLLRWADDGIPAGTALVLLRTTGLLLGAAAPFVLADDMADSTGAVPSPRWLRQWLRTGLALGAAAAAWTATYLVVGLWTRTLPPLPETALVAAVCVLVGLAAAAVAVRRVPQQYGAGAGAAVVALLFAASVLLPDGWSPWPGPGTPQWDPVHLGWLVAAPVPVVVLAVAHRDRR